MRWIYSSSFNLNLNLRWRHRATQQITLDFLASDTAKEIELLNCFDTLGDYSEA